MVQKVIQNKEKLLEISERKVKLLQSVIDQFDHIESNPIFIDEINDAYMELVESESMIVAEKEITIDCPDCGFECSQIHSFCMACGAKLEHPSGMAV